MSNMKLDVQTISLDDIGRAYIAAHEAEQAVAHLYKKFAAGRVTVGAMQAAEEAAETARKHRNALVLHFAAGAHCNVVTLYGEAA